MQLAPQPLCTPPPLHPHRPCTPTKSTASLQADSQMRHAVESTARARVPGWLRLVDVCSCVLGVCWCAWAVYTFRTADALVLCLAYCAGLALTLSPRFSLEAHCLFPTAWAMCALGVAFAAELVWSRLGTGTFVLPPQPVLAYFLASKGLLTSLLISASQVRCHLAPLQGWARAPWDAIQALGAMH
jgi:hypothetical protein